MADFVLIVLLTDIPILVILRVESMKKPALGINPSVASNVTSRFLHQVLGMKKHARTRTRDEPFSCALCDFKFSTSSALIEEA